MQSTVKDTYTVAQSRMMYLAYTVLTWMAIGIMIFEYINTSRPFPQADLLFLVIGGITGLMFSMAAMLIVEVTFQNQMQQMPLISSLSRLTPELSLVERYSFLTVSFKRQITSTISLTAFWILLGGTSRGWSLVFAMALITVVTAYGIFHLKSLPPEKTEATPEQPGELTNRIMLH